MWIRYSSPLLSCSVMVAPEVLVFLVVGFESPQDISVRNGFMNCDINKLINFRHGSARKYDIKPPNTHNLFDWVFWDTYEHKTLNPKPKTILCKPSPKCIRALAIKTKEISNEHKSTLVIAGQDRNLSKSRRLIDPILDRFDRIFYEAKDIEHDKISSFSMGFISFYLKRSGHENIKAAIELSNTQEKEKLLLAAWGKHWGFLDKKIKERESAIIFLRNHQTFKREMIDVRKYWTELAKSKFLLAPTGRGIQSPKLAEAWMVKAIPIVIKNPCFVDIKKMGFPLIIINKWEDINVNKLEKWYDKHRKIDWKRVRYQLTNDYLKELIGNKR